MVKKGRHRRFEEARALKRSDNIDLDALLDNLSSHDGTEGTYKPEHDAWADLAAEYEKQGSDDDEIPDELDEDDK